jgi:phosphotransferase system HPr-like phosphotransfer protein
MLQVSLMIKPVYGIFNRPVLKIDRLLSTYTSHYTLQSGSEVRTSRPEVLGRLRYFHGGHNQAG